MEIIVLGSGTAIPDAHHGCPGIAVEVGGSLLFLDLGSGSLYRAARYGLALDRLAAVLLTHFHPDHTTDLVPLLFAFRNPEYNRRKDLLLFGPVGMSEYLDALRSVYGSWIEASGYRCEVKSPVAAQLDLGGWHLRTLPVPHSPEALAYEITESGGKRLVYSGDTDECESLSVFASEADLLILECSFPEGRKVEGHLTPSTAGRMAGKANCKRLLLTHFYPACLGQDLVTPCRRFYSGPIMLARDGLRVSL